MTPYTALIAPKPNLCERVRALGHRLLVVDHPARLTAPVTGLADLVIGADPEDTDALERLLAPLHRAGALRAVLSVNETALAAAAALTERFGLIGNGTAAVHRTRNKRAMREALASRPEFAVPHREVRSLSEAEAFARECGAVVCKPVDGAGSQGVRRFAAGEEIRVASFPLLAEQLLTGKEYSVETVTVDGEHTVLGVTEKLLYEGSVVEQGHIFPAPLEDAVRERMHRYVADVLTALGVVTGLAHTEVMLTEDGPRVIETHTRCGGDHLSKLIALATGVDVLELAVAVAAGDAPPLKTPEADRTAMIAFLDLAPGAVERVWGLDAARHRPGVNLLECDARPGSVIAPIADSYSRPGFVIVTGADAAEARARAAEAERSVRIEYR